VSADTAHVLILLGRFLLGAHFFIAGVRNFRSFTAHTAALAERNVPLPVAALAVGLAVQTIGGAMVALGIWPAIAAPALIAFTIVATVLFHNFWAFTGAERVMHTNFNLTNMALCGALLMAAAT
jgi:putative oxidoreductase